MELEAKVAQLASQLDLVSRKLDIIMSVMGVNIPDLQATGVPGVQGPPTSTTLSPRVRHSSSGEGKCFRVFQNNIFESCDSICCGSHASFDTHDAPPDAPGPSSANAPYISESDCASPKGETSPRLSRDRTSFTQWVDVRRKVGQEVRGKLSPRGGGVVDQRLMQYSEAIEALDRKCEEFDFQTGKKSEKAAGAGNHSRHMAKTTAAQDPPRQNPKFVRAAGQPHVQTKMAGGIQNVEAAGKVAQKQQAKKWVRGRTLSHSSTKSSTSVGSVGMRREEMAEFMKGMNGTLHFQRPISARAGLCTKPQHKLGSKIGTKIEERGKIQEQSRVPVWEDIEEDIAEEFAGESDDEVDNWKPLLDGTPEDNLKKLTAALDVLNRTGFSCKGQKNLTQEWGRKIDELVSGMKTDREQAEKRSGRESARGERGGVIMKYSKYGREQEINMGKCVQGDLSTRGLPTAVQAASARKVGWRF